MSESPPDDRVSWRGSRFFNTDSESDPVLRTAASRRAAVQLEAIEPCGRMRQLAITDGVPGSRSASAASSRLLGVTHQSVAKSTAHASFNAR